MKSLYVKKILFFLVFFFHLTRSQINEIPVQEFRCGNFREKPIEISDKNKLPIPNDIKRKLDKGDEYKDFNIVLDLENFNFNDDSIPNKEIQVLSPMEQIK